MNRDENAEWKIQTWHERKKKLIGKFVRYGKKVKTEHKSNFRRAKKFDRTSNKLLFIIQCTDSNVTNLTHKTCTKPTLVHTHTTVFLLFVSICRNCCFYISQFRLLFSVWLLPVFLFRPFLFVCSNVWVPVSVFVCQIKSHHQQTTRGEEEEADRELSLLNGSSNYTDIGATVFFLCCFCVVHAWIVANFLAPNCIRRFERGKSNNAPKKYTTDIGLGPNSLT